MKGKSPRDSQNFAYTKPVFPKDQNFESPLDSHTLNFGGPLTPVPKILGVLFKFNFSPILTPFKFCDNTFDIKQFVLDSLYLLIRLY